MHLDERSAVLAEWIPCRYWVKSYWWFVFRKTAIFCFCSVETKLLILDQIWGHIAERTLKELSNALSCGAVALLVPKSCASFSKKCWNRPNLIFDDLWWSDLWPDLKNDQAIIGFTNSCRSFKATLWTPSEDRKQKFSAIVVKFYFIFTYCRKQKILLYLVYRCKLVS